MEELSIKEKAERYDEALDRAKKELDTCGSQDCDAARQVFRLFPELKESEDERIRKSIIAIINNYVDNSNTFKPKMLAWLEKQGEPKSYWKPSKDEMDALYGLAYITNKMDDKKDEAITKLYQDLKREFFNGSSYENMFPNTEDGVRRRSTIQVLEYARSLDSYNQYGKEDIDKNIAWLEKLEKQGEQKPADKVVPKFHEGDIIIHKELGGDYIHNPHKIIQVDILDKKYRLEGGLVVHFSEQDDYELVEQESWSEEDEMFVHGLIRGLAAKRDIHGHTTFSSDCIDITKTIDWLKSLKERVQPQPKQEWSEEDKNMARYIGNAITTDEASNYLKEKDIEVIDAHVWLDSFKDRVQPQPKQEWSEEDEKYIKDLTDYFTGGMSLKHTEEDIIAWIKSFRPQSTWKPSDEQMRELSIVATGKGYFSKDILSELLEQLKKLK